MEVHPPEHGIHSWRDFIVHMGTITLGLLIAIGLEQSVEWVHHRHQVAAIRHDLEIERRMNALRFSIEAKDWRRFTPLLQNNLRAVAWLRTHPGAPASECPCRMTWFVLSFSIKDAAWETARQSPALEYMPRSEVQGLSSFYSRLKLIQVETDARFEGLIRAKLYLQHAPDLQHLTPEQMDKLYDILLEAIGHDAVAAISMRNMSRHYPDFSGAPTNTEIYAIVPPVPNPEDVDAVAKLLEEEQRAELKIEEAGTDATSAPHR